MSRHSLPRQNTPGQLHNAVILHPALYTTHHTFAPQRNSRTLVLLTFPPPRILHPAFYTCAVQQTLVHRILFNRNAYLFMKNDFETHIVQTS